MKTDSEIQNDVIDELKWDPAVNHEHIGVAVNDGIVSLTGHVPSYFERFSAERAALRVTGVKAVAQELKVRVPGTAVEDDEALAGAILHAFKWNVQIPDDKVKAKVSDGWVTLSGDVEWDYQKSAAENAVAPLAGVKGVTNAIVILPKLSPENVKRKIEQALKRTADRDAARIAVAVDGRKVTLTGKVRSYAEAADARVAAWNAPGVSEVRSDLTVSP